MSPLAEAEGTPHWEERARRREREDPRRRHRIQERMNGTLAEQLPALLGALGAFHFLYAAWIYLGLDADPGRGRLSVVALLPAVVLGGGALLIRRRGLPPESAHPALFAAAVVLALAGLAQVLVSGDVIYSIGFILTLMASGAFALDRRWLAGMVLAVVALWGLAMLVVPPDPGRWPHLAMGMGLGTLLAGLVVRFRTENLSRLESLNLELEALVGLDGLTGIANRRAFEDRLKLLWRRLAGERASLSLLLLDLDYFKNLNDTRGHSEGDAALRQIGGVLRMVVRNTDDLPARLGGEEFAVLLPRTDQDQALLVAERIREAVAFIHIPNPGVPTGDILTLSQGLAVTWPSGRMDPAALLDRADEALYRAKESGRNRIVVEQGRKGPEPALTRLEDLGPTPEEGAGDAELPRPPTDDPFWKPAG